MFRVCKTSRYIYIYSSSTWIEKYRVTRNETFFPDPLVWGYSPPIVRWTRKGGHAFVPPRGGGFPLVNSYTLYGYRSSGLPRRKDGFCERVTRGSPWMNPTLSGPYQFFFLSLFFLYIFWFLNKFFVRIL